MSTLDDFFGSSETAVKECSYCGGTDGELVVSARDDSGPTHWHHVECLQQERVATPWRDQWYDMDGGQ